MEGRLREAQALAGGAVVGGVALEAREDELALEAARRRGTRLSSSRTPMRREPRRSSACTTRSPDGTTTQRAHSNATCCAPPAGRTKETRASSTRPWQPGAIPVYRLYNRDSGAHLFTHDTFVRDSILAMFPGIWVEHDRLGYAYEGP